MTEQELKVRIRKIGLNIAYYRKLKGLSQEQLSEKAFLSRQWLGQVEAPGMTALPSLETLLILAEALEIEPAALLDFRWEPQLDSPGAGRYNRETSK